jgi:SpoVK/Ycf46/Vps4 family AAA+-type ATPase
MNTLAEPEVEEALREQVAGMQNLLQQILDKAPRVLCKVKMGPIFDNGNQYYRVQDLGGGTQIAGYKEEYVFKNNHKGPLKEGMEVIVSAGIVIGITPEPLKPKEVLPVFDLIDWADIGGLKSQIDDIRETIELPLANAKLAKELGLKPSKGILLYGPPGCGKTLIAKAIASTVIGAKRVDAEAFTYIKGGELLSMYVGQTEQRIASIFKNAREYSAKTGKRSVIFIDEAEALLNKRGSRRSSDVDSTIVPTFLAEMDGFDEHGPFMLLSTNLPNSLDEAVIREGRIDSKIEIFRPTSADSFDIFKIHLNKVKIAEDIDDLAKFATDTLFAHQASSNVSGAMIETIVDTAIRKALSRKVSDKKSPLGVIEEDIQKAIDSLT